MVSGILVKVAPEARRQSLSPGLATLTRDPESRNYISFPQMLTAGRGRGVGGSTRRKLQNPTGWSALMLGLQVGQFRRMNPGLWPP